MLVGCIGGVGFVPTSSSNIARGAIAIKTSRIVTTTNHEERHINQGHIFPFIVWTQM